MCAMRTDAPRARAQPTISSPDALPGADLVERGLADLRAGHPSIEGMLVLCASDRLADHGIAVPPSPVTDPEDVLYRLIRDEVGEAGAHSRYNALRRRLVSYLNALRATSAG